jgi:hypothetical protein
MKIKLLIFVFLGMIAAGCGPTQKVTGFWADPEAASKGPYKKAFVIVITPNKDANYQIESQIRNTLISRGYKVVGFNDIFPPGLTISADYTREQLSESIRKTGCDAVMTLALLDSKTVESYHPGTVYAPVNYNYYQSYYGYYNYYSPMVYSPGYYSVDKTFYLETNLYDLASDKLIWSVQSEARNPKDLDKWFKNYSVMLTNHLKGKGLAKK